MVTVPWTVAATLTRSISTAWRSHAGTRYGFYILPLGSKEPAIHDYHKPMLTIFPSLGLLLQIPTLRAAILRHLPQRQRANPLLATSRQRAKPLLLRSRQSYANDPIIAQPANQMHARCHRQTQHRHRQHPRPVELKQRSRYCQPRLGLCLLRSER